MTNTVKWQRCWLPNKDITTAIKNTPRVFQKVEENMNMMKETEDIKKTQVEPL